MDALAALALIAWIALSVFRKKKQKEAAEAAKRASAERAATQTAPTAPPAAKPQYDAPVERPAASKPDFDPFFGGLMDALNELDPNARKQAAPQAPAARPAQPAGHQAVPLQQPPKQRVQSGMQSQMADRTTTMQSTLRHALEASSITGHAHTESSITGVEPECAPADTRFPKNAHSSVQQDLAPETGSAFTWNVDDAARGLILSEILGKPRALQR